MSYLKTRKIFKAAKGGGGTVDQNNKKVRDQKTKR